MRVPRILLVSNVSPLGAHVGSLYLRPLCEALPPDTLHGVIVGKQPEGTSPSGAFGARFTYLNVATNVLRARRPSLRARAERWMDWRRLQAETVPAIVEACLAAARLHAPDLVWVVLHEPAITLAASRIASRLALPLVTTVWDPPEYVLWRNGSDRLTARRLLEAFGTAVGGSRCCSVMSDAMGQDYQRRYGARTVVMRLGVPAAQRHAPRPEPKRPDAVTIGFAGDLYAEDAWWSLMRALNECGFRIADRNVRLRVIGSRAVFQSAVPTHAEFLGRRSSDETIRLLAETDIAYVPYWFDPSYTIAARQSFPTKVSAALGAGTPILFHGPEASSVVQMMRQHPFGAACTSLDTKAVIEALERLLARYAECSEAIARALVAEFSMDVFLTRFADLIGANAAEIKLDELRR